MNCFKSFFFKLYFFIFKKQKSIHDGVFYINGSDTLPPPLSKEEEAKAFAELAENSSQARETLIVHNLRLVVYIAKKFESTGTGVEDLISIGTIAVSYTHLDVYKRQIHTSTVTVAVLAEADEVELEINPADLKIDVFRASGAGGQHINKTESAVRITHLPTGCVVECQDERSQFKNKDKAMKILRSRLYEMLLNEQNDKIASERRTQVGTCLLYTSSNYF